MHSTIPPLLKGEFRQIMCNDFYGSIMGQPTINRVADTTASSGDNTIVAAPGAGLQLCVLYVYIQNESANATVAKLDVDGEDISRSTLGQYVDYTRDYMDRPLILPENTAFVLNLSGANAHAYIVDYVII